MPYQTPSASEFIRYRRLQTLLRDKTVEDEKSKQAGVLRSNHGGYYAELSNMLVIPPNFLLSNKFIVPESGGGGGGGDTQFIEYTFESGYQSLEPIGAIPENFTYVDIVVIGIGGSGAPYNPGERDDTDIEINGGGGGSGAAVVITNGSVSEIRNSLDVKVGVNGSSVGLFRLVGSSDTEFVTVGSGDNAVQGDGGSNGTIESIVNALNVETQVDYEGTDGTNADGILSGGIGGDAPNPDFGLYGAGGNGGYISNGGIILPTSGGDGYLRLTFHN
jgi:hypothetical protein